ncbi:MAG: radical SAM protein [Syntrophobacteraceae bacterium]
MPPKKTIYPVFLPHAGCPFQCVYCNQRAVVSSGPGRPDPVAQTEARLAEYAQQVEASGRPGEIAFYGGTFTALPGGVLRAVLDSAASLVERGIFTGIRFSTRPDCLDEKVCALLARYPVSTVELGVQSLSDRVLEASGRGYAASAVFDSAARVRGRGWSLGIQLMAGLPEDSAETFLESVRRAIGIGPDFLRIYPTLVLEGTRLAIRFRSGTYRPLELDEAIEWVLPAYDMLLSAAIPVVRMGLHADPALDEPGVVLAGPHHPAFGYLVRCRWWRERVERELAGRQGERLLIRAAPNLVSDVVGPGRANIRHWESAGKLRGIKVIGDGGLSGTQMVLESIH